MSSSHFVPAEKVKKPARAVLSARSLTYRAKPTILFFGTRTSVKSAGKETSVGMELNLCNIRDVKDLMSIFHLSFRKDLGQNFLIDSLIVSDIADLCSPDPDCTVLEIGPGVGTLTRELASRYRKVVAVEIDQSLIPVLNYTLNDFSNVTVIRDDVMKLDLAEVLGEELKRGPVSVCANLPYYITTPILTKLLRSGFPFGQITVMIQNEVAQRLCAPVGSKNSGAITVFMAYYGECTQAFTVPPDRFVPSPNVTSSVMQIRLHKERPVHPRNEELFFKTVRIVFEQRRKNILNALTLGFPDMSKETATKIIGSFGWPAELRGERLSLKEFSDLSDCISSYGLC